MGTDKIYIGWKKNKCRALLYASMIVLHVLSVPALAQPVVTLSDRSEHVWIGRSVSYLEDAENKLSINDLLSDRFDSLYRPCTQEAPNFGNVETTIWNRFIITNQSDKKWILSVLNYNIDTLILLYRDKMGVARRLLSGSSQPLSSRALQTPYYSFELPVKKGDTMTFYLKVQTYIFQYPLLISGHDRFISDLHINNLLKGIYYGLALLFIIYNLVLFITLKDRNYLYYVLYIFFTSLIMSEHAGINALIWGDHFHFLWNRGPLILALAQLFFLIFSRSFLETRRHAPRSHLVINYILIPAVCMCIVFNLAGKNLYASVLNQLAGMGTLVFMTFTALSIYRKGFRPARYYILACSFYFAGVVIFILKTFAIIPYNYFTTNSMEIGSALEMMMFSFSMADRMNIFKKEKEIAQDKLMYSMQENERIILEQNKLLEVKVDERTHELKQTLDALELSQDELQKKNLVITKEKERSDELLLNILPGEVADELKEKGFAEARQFEEVTVMFTDFKNFTKVSEHLSPKELVSEIHTCFKAFDEIIEKYNIEKIKTIGDAYMCASGLPVPNPQHAADMVRAAIEIRDFMIQQSSARSREGEMLFEIRIGIHSGPVVAGIVGIRKFAYDIWGDTVNTASRMESSGEAGKINISEHTWERIRENFVCTYRGKIEAKNKGEIDMYFVEKEIGATVPA